MRLGLLPERRVFGTRKGFVMPGFSVLNDIAKAVQSQIVTALNAAPDIDFDLDETTVILAPPSDSVAADVVATLYLYHVDVDPHLRNRRLIPASDPTLMIKPPLPLQLRFLFVPRDTDEDHNQLMLGRVLQHFHDFPTFKPAPGSPLAKSRGGAPEELRVRYDLASYQDLANLWSGFSQPYRLSAGLLVEIATLDSGKAAEQMPRVGEMFGSTTIKPVEADT